MKTQTTIYSSIRLPEERTEYIKKKASEIGISQNAFMLMLIDLGIKLYEGKMWMFHHRTNLKREKKRS